MPTPRIRTVAGSCWACKERRVLCDLAVPACLKCRKSGRRCDYSKVKLKWTDCIASRGRLAGRKTPLYHPPAIRRTQDDHLLYFEVELLPRFHLSNVVPAVDLGVFKSDPVLCQSIVAVANAHQTYAYRTPDDKDSLSRIRDRDAALGAFRRHLTASYAEEMSDSLFIANVLLCILDGILEPNSENSATHYHLLGGKAILTHWGGSKAIFDAGTELPLLMLSIFATMDLTHAVLLGDAPYLEVDAWKKFGDCAPWWGNVPPDDDFLETMAITAHLATLGYGVKHAKTVVPIDRLLSIQQTLDQQAERQKKLVDPEALAWAAFCSAYRFAATVYLYRALSGLDVDHELVQQAVAGCMAVVSGENLTPTLHHCILFPLLVIGTHCMTKEQRVAIRQSLVQTATYLSFESLRSLEMFLEKRWANLDSKPEFLKKSWWEYYDEIAAATCLF